MPHFAAATRLVSSAFGGFLRNKKMAPKTNHAKKTRTRVTTPTMSILIRSPEKRYAEKPRKIASSPPSGDPLYGFVRRRKGVILGPHPKKGGPQCITNCKRPCSEN